MGVVVLDIYIEIIYMNEGGGLDISINNIYTDISIDIIYKEG